MGLGSAFTVMLVAPLLAGACSNDESSNDAVRDAITKNGVDPSSELTYEHFFYFDDETSVRSAENDLVSAGIRRRSIAARR